ncbi:hypothetical protein [Brevundimonas aurifodinae]|uniref:DUF4932 domain-containing protein n=1 Tax=Brevundimonas aurifodinae TaxID=1508312 RepID=A0ABV1NKZ0_9CAUL
MKKPRPDLNVMSGSIEGRNADRTDGQALADRIQVAQRRSRRSTFGVDIGAFRLDRRKFAINAALLGLALHPEPGLAQTPDGAEVVVHRPTELAWILAGLSPLDRGGNALNRDTAYWRAAETWFGAFQDHPAVTALGDDFNLPRLIGNAANYTMNAQGDLTRSPGSRAMWDDPAGDLFSRHRDLIASFGLESRALAFFDAQRDTLEESRSTLAGAVELADMQSWLEVQFVARPGAMTVFVSPVTGGWNFTNLDPETPRLWVPAATRPATPYDRFRIVRAIFTEMDHNYVNPATARLGPSAFGFMTEANGWATPEAWSNYGTAELIINEYMTFSAFLAYAQDRLAGEDLARTETETRRLMERRGFIRFARFADAVSGERRRGVNLEALYPAVMAAMRL